jgi:hypothetical protein
MAASPHHRTKFEDGIIPPFAAAFLRELVEKMVAEADQALVRAGWFRSSGG